MKSVEEYRELKERLEEAKLDLAELKGQEKQIKLELAGFDVKTIKAARERLDIMEKELNKLEKTIQEKMDAADAAMPD